MGVKKILTDDHPGRRDMAGDFPPPHPLGLL